MFCTKCGQPLPENAEFCFKCGTQIGHHILSEVVEEEFIIKQGLCNHIKSPFFTENGHCLLTNKRFIYLKHGLTEILTGGLLKNYTKEFELEIPINQIARIKEGRQGISKTIIICTKSEQNYNFYFSYRQDWVSEFNNLIETNF